MCALLDLSHYVKSIEGKAVMQQPAFSQPFPNQLQINLFVQRLVLFPAAHLFSNVDTATASSMDTNSS